MRYAPDYKISLEKSYELLEDAEISEIPIDLNKIIDCFSNEISVKTYSEYMNDAENRLKRSTIANKLIIANTHILPFFGDMAIKDITPIVVREWQNGLLKAVSAMTGRKYTQTYLRTVNAELSACFNYAVKFYNLQENPVVKAGNIGATSAREMNIWTLEEFNLFNKDNITDPQKHLMFNLLFWGGMRMGEAMALTWEDIDFKNQKININKTYQRMGTEDVVTTPKTPKSTRILTMNESIIEELREYKRKQYKPKATGRIFTYSNHIFDSTLKKGAKKNNLQEIRLHDLRHSHASLLLHLGVNIVVISKRLGHEKIETTFNTYSHMYPEQEDNLLKLLEKIEKNNK